ncbi:MAG: DNA polymerase III subunit alpha [Ilumatobacteraceae bacterium]|nr:DNA polymerase III subunit alpha [Ilumatobacteraceae bacterium]MBP7890772.1 DNA polymerase III subunit alpha [Ilumatobacteraceae bacterium]MBP8208498.1 DNA polymerase III subunit alpha [Ilumatobacteraceae bacterium]HQY15041.1 DNA polymerase III subunit alpha [Ilumatobacteraceae bacterium]HQY86495.1 DNA polymerase III subunit alpha [Ilumatobacteraceae bacterium]
MGDSFTHLHVHTEFSMLDGAARLDELVAKAVQDGQPALGITDHGNMYGVLDFFKECRKQGVKPIIGTEAYMAFESRHERPARRGRVDDSGGDTEGGKKLYYHLTLLAETDQGYRNLIQLASLAFLEGYYYKPRMDWELLEKYHHGLIATTGCLGGHVLQSLLQGDEKGALQKAGRLQEIFGKDNLFVELQDHGLAAQRDTNPQLIEIAKKIGAPLIATNDSHYVHREDHESHDALLCVQTGALISDPKRFKFEGNEHYLKSANEMRHLFRDFPEACDNTLWVAERADVNIEFGKPLLPNFPIPAGFLDDAGFLDHLTWEGAKQRWGDTLPVAVVERLAYELQVIKNMGFASYFLIVWDLIKHAKDSGIRVGPGRGSAAGCAVAYSLRITDLDPIKYDLLFERFLNPSRISMPDIDMDFDSRYRDEMIRYAAEKYGRDHVAQIITFGTIKARNAVRDAARVLGYPYGMGDKVAKLMPPLVMGRDTPLKYCFEQNPKYADGYKAASELRATVEADPDVKRIVHVAKGLEGLKRSDGIHAAAVVITKDPLTNYLPVQRKPVAGGDPADAPIVTQFEMHGVEELGLLKMDFLGLRNLDVISDTVAMVRATKDPEFDIDSVHLDDQAVFDLMARGDTMGVFQLESPPMRALLRSLAPTSFEDVSAVLALYRPGPMSVNMHYDYADRKNGRQAVSFFHEDAKEVLGDTYGLMIYQESVMRVAQKFAGYSLAEADNLRKAMGKKSREVMAAARSAFEEGCTRTGYTVTLGKELFDVIEKFADYAFNKSHTFGYGLVTYQTAFLKAHYPVEYMACLLTSVKSNLDKAAVYLSDARANGVKVLTPDINRSITDFAALTIAEVPVDVVLPAGSPGAITFGLSAIRNVGEGLVELLLRERDQNGPYDSFHEYAERVPEPVLNKRTVESLIKAGAFDSLGHPRKGLLMVFEQIIDGTLVRRRERDQGVMSLFGDVGDDAAGGFNERVAIPTLEFDKSDRLKFEKEMLGLYISDHPLLGVEAALRRKVDCSVAEAAEKDDGAMITLGGVITNLSRKFTKKGDQMAVFVLEDLDSAIEVTVFPRVLTEQGHKLIDDAIVTVKGRIDRRDEVRIGFMAQDVQILEGLDTGSAAPLRLRVPATSLTELKIHQIRKILREHPGDSPVYLHIGQGKVLRLADDFCVDLDRVVGELRMALGHDAVVL